MKNDKTNEDKLRDYRKMDIWKLNYKIVEKNNRIINLIKSGETNKNSVLRKLKERKRLMYKAMLEKLKKWEKGELFDTYPTFAELNKIKRENKE